jgi:hypothetical protein
MVEAMKYFRKAITLWLLILCATNAYTQSWFPGGAQWHHEYFNGAFIGYIHMEADGDTLIAGQQAQVLRRTVVAASFDGGPLTVWHFVPLAAIEESGLVRVWVPSELAFDTLWNMNAAPGDQWNLAAMTEPTVCDPESFVSVVDTGHIFLSGTDLRWLAVDLHYFLSGTEWNVERDTIIERIGSTLLYFTPHDFCNGQLDGADGGALRCYSDTELSYSRIAPWSCETLLSITDVEKPLRAELLPVVGHGCRVQLAAGTAARLELFDGVGRRLKQLQVRDGDLVL